MEKLTDFVRPGSIQTVLVPNEEFEEIGEFGMPLEKDSIMNVDISNELKLLERFGYNGQE